MQSETSNSTILKPILILAGTSIIIFAMRGSSVILSPFLLALIIGISVLPATRWLIDKGVSTGLALTITIGLVVLGVAGLILLVGISVGDLVASLPQYQENMQGLIDNIKSGLNRVGIDQGQLQGSLDSVDSGKIISWVASFLGSILNSLSGLVVMLMVLVFFIIGAPMLSTKIRTDFAINNPVFSRFRETIHDLQQYVIITTWINFLVGVVNTIFLIILGIDYAILWGLLSFLTGYIPNVGFWIALIPPFLLALLQFGWVKAAIVLVGYVLINGGVQNFLQPKMMGQGLNLSVLVVTLSLFFWGWVLGPMGALLAIPLTIIVKEVFLDAYDDTRGLADVMSGESTPESNAADHQAT